MHPPPPPTIRNKVESVIFFVLGAACLNPVLSYQGLSLGLSVSEIILVNGLSTCLSLPSSPISGKLKEAYLQKQNLKELPN